MMKNIFQIETFNNDYFCDKCNKKSKEAVKSSALETCPPYLIVTLNRFYVDKDKNYSK